MRSGDHDIASFLITNTFHSDRQKQQGFLPAEIRLIKFRINSYIQAGIQYCCILLELYDASFSSCTLVVNIVYILFKLAEDFWIG